MAVIKKLQKGGFAETSSNPNLSFKDFIVNKLNNTKFTKKGESFARSSADKFAKLYELDNFNEIYSYDPISQQYTINQDKIKDDELKRYDWGGSKDEINKNILGKYSGKGDSSNKGEDYAEQKKFNTLMASWINEYSNLNKKSEKPQQLGVDKKIQNLWSYISKEGYNDDEGAFASSEWNKITDPESRKNKIKEHASNLVNRYLTDYQNKGSNRYDESEIEKVTRLKQALNSNDWDLFKNSAVSLGWDIDKLINVNKEEGAEEKIKSEEELQKERYDKALKVGTDPKLAESGFIKINDPNNPLWKFRKSNEDIYEKNGKFYIFGVTPEGFSSANRLFSERGNEYYGGALKTTEEGTQLLQPGSWEERDLNPELIQELTTVRGTPESFIQSEIDNYINIFGKSDQLFPLVDESGNKLFGSPQVNWFGNKSLGKTNIFNHLDPTSTIFKKEGDNWVTYEKGEDNKYYKIGEFDKSFNVISRERINTPVELNPKLESTTFDEDLFYPYYRRNLSKIGVSEGFNESNLEQPEVYAPINYIKGIYNLAKNKNTSIQHTRDLITSYLRSIERSDPNKYRGLLFKLPKSVQNFITGKSDQMDVSELNSNDEKLNASFNWFDAIKTTNPLFKSGGKIKKLQSGGKNESWDEYLKKYNISSQEEINKNKETKSTVNPTHNRAFGSGPVAIKNEKIDKAIMAANVGSLAPGIIGAGSALTATGLELVRDLGDPEKSGWETTGNLALNLGLAGAAFFGAGFLRGAKSGAKIASTLIKTTDKVSDIQKTIKGIDVSTDITKLTKGAVSGISDIEKSLKNIEKFEKLTKSATPLSLQQIAKQATINLNTKGASKSLINSSKKVLEDVGKVSAFTEGIAKSKSIIPVINSTDLLRKGTNVAMNTMVIGSAAANLPEAINTVGKIKDVAFGNEDVGNITTDDVNSLVSVLFASKIGGMKIKQAIGKKYGTVVTDKTPSKLSVTFEDGKTVTINNAKEPSKNYLRKKSNRLDSEDKASILKEYNKGLKESEQVKELPKIKSISDYSPEVISGRRIRNAGEIDYSKNYWLQLKGTQWANRYKLYEPSNFRSTSLYGKVKDKLHFVTPADNPIITETPKVTKPTVKRSRKPKVTKQTTNEPIINTENSVIKEVPVYKKPLELQARKIDLKHKQVYGDWRKYKKGGILKAQLGLKIPSLLNRISTTPIINNTSNIPSFNFLENKKLSINSKLTTPNLTQFSNIKKTNTLDPLTNKSLTTPEYKINMGLRGKQFTEPKKQTGFANSIIPEVKQNKGLNIDVDKVDVLNSLQALNTIRGNKDAANQMIKSITAKMVPSQLMSKPYIKSQTPNAVFSSKLSSGVTDTARRLASANTNLALGTAAQLDAAKKASDIRFNANLADQQQAAQTDQIRSNLGLQIDQTNLNIANQNRQRMAEGEAGIHQVNAGLSTANTTAINTLLKSFGENYKVRDSEKTRSELVNYMNNPEYESALKNYQDIASGSRYKSLYDQYQTAMKGKDVKIIPWEESDYGKTWKSEVDKAKSLLEPYQKRMQLLQTSAMMGVPYSRIKF